MSDDSPKFNASCCRCREKLIQMAMLLGSDYTEGVAGIGVVNALEVVQAFPGEEGFVKFKEWLESPDTELLNAAKTGADDLASIYSAGDTPQQKQFKLRHRQATTAALCRRLATRFYRKCIAFCCIQRAANILYLLRKHVLLLLML